MRQTSASTSSSEGKRRPSLYRLVCLPYSFESPSRGILEDYAPNAYRPSWHHVLKNRKISILRYVLLPFIIISPVFMILFSTGLESFGWRELRVPLYFCSIVAACTLPFFPPILPAYMGVHRGVILALCTAMVLARLSYTEFFEWLLPLILAVSILLFLDMFSFPRRPVMRILFTWVLKIFSFVGFAANAFVGVELIESTDGVTRSAGIGMFTFCILLILPLMLCALENDELKKDVRVILFYPALVGKPLMIIIEFLFYPFWQASTYNMIIAILAVFTTAVSLIFGFFEVLGLISLDEWGQKAREHLASGGGCMGDCVKDLRARSRRMSRRFSTHLSIRMASLSRNASESVAHNRSPGTAEKTVTPKPPDDMSCMVLFDPDPDPTQEEEVKVEGQHRRKSISFHIDTLDVEVAALFPLPAIQEEEEEAKGDGKIEEEEADDEAEIPSEGLQRSSHSFDDLEPGLPLDVTTAKRLCATMPKLPLIAPRGLGFSCIPPTSSHQTQTEKEVLGSGRKEREHKKNEAVAYSPASDPVLQHDTEKGKGTPVPTQKKEKQQEDNLDAVPREPMAEILPAVGRTAR